MVTMVVMKKAMMKKAMMKKSSALEEIIPNDDGIISTPHHVSATVIDEKSKGCPPYIIS